MKTGGFIQARLDRLRKSMTGYVERGAIGPLLFMVVFLIEGATTSSLQRLAGRCQRAQPGEGGWMQITNFIVLRSARVRFCHRAQAAPAHRPWPARYRWPLPHRVSVTLSPTLTLFLPPHGKLYLLLQELA